jgi:hypothetical protein
MAFQNQDGIRYYRFDLFEPGLVQAVLTRRGGVSPEPWASLNLGGSVGDDPERVRANRLRALDALGRDPASVHDVWQVHGVNVVVAEAPRLPEQPPVQADVLLTDRPGLTLLMRFADCVPILLHDPVRKVAGIAHAGWMGTVQGVARTAVEVMQSRFGCRPGNILAAVGPSIGPDHYEIGEDVGSRVRQAFGADAAGLLAGDRQRMTLDLWAANRLLLEQAGVRQLEVAGLCTACHLEDWFSHRAENGRTGRFGALLALA